MNIFISHSQSEANVAEGLAARLTGAGHNVWRDQPAEVGESVSGAIAHAIDEADAYVILVSPQMLDSEWSLLEVGGALAESETTGKPVIPALLDEDVEVPALLRDRAYVDLSDPSQRESGFAEIEDALAADRSRREPWPAQGDKQVELFAAAERYLDEEISHYLTTRQRQETLFRRRFRVGVVLTVLTALCSLAAVALSGDAILSTLLALFGGVAIGALTIVLGSIAGVVWPSRRVVDLLVHHTRDGDGGQ